jgi:hypothetical protein
VCVLNRLAASVTAPLVGLNTLQQAAVVTGGATTSGGEGERIGAGSLRCGLRDPNESVAGNSGDSCQRRDEGKMLYVFEPGTGNVVRWTPK